jgi:hypothetical protein
MVFAFGRGGEAWGRGVRKVKNNFFSFKMYKVDCLHGQKLFSKLYKILCLTKMYDTICGQIYPIHVNIAYFAAKSIFLKKKF